MDTKTSFKGLISKGAVNFGRHSNDYALYRPGLPAKIYDEKLSYLLSKHYGGPKKWAWSRLQVLDLGTGPGLVALEVARRGSTVVGIDISSQQIESAKLLASERGLSSKVKFFVATAEKTEQKSQSFDLITAGQCWPWFDHEKSMKEIHRILKPNGVLAVIQYAYLPRHSKVAKETEDLILKFNPKWTMAGFDGLYPTQVDQLTLQGKLTLIEQFTFDYLQPFTHEQWRGRIRTCNGVGSGVLSDAEVEKFDRELDKLLKDKYSKEPIEVWHRAWGVVVTNKPASKL